jgi:hypothetical protein
MSKDPKIEQTKRLIGALLRMPPKPHTDMKVGKPRAAKNPAKKRGRGVSAKAKTS